MSSPPEATAPRRRFAWPLFLIVSAVVVSVVILALLRVPRDETGAAEPFALADLEGRAWVAGFAAACESEQANDTLARIAGSLPPKLELICFSMAVPPELAVSGPERWKLLHGKAEDLRRLMVARIGFSTADADACAAGTTELFATISRKGRTIGLHRATRGDLSGLLTGLAADADWLASIDRRPAFHAMMNGLSALLILCGLFCIRKRLIGAHVTFMLMATGATVLFLVSYLYYHHHAGSTGFQGVGAARWLYFGILLTHTFLAAFLVPLVLTLLTHALRRRFDKHRSLARWTYPIWLYVSTTGVLIYLMLYVWFAG